MYCTYQHLHVLFNLLFSQSKWTYYIHVNTRCVHINHLVVNVVEEVSFPVYDVRTVVEDVRMLPCGDADWIEWFPGSRGWTGVSKAEFAGLVDHHCYIKVSHTDIQVPVLTEVFNASTRWKERFTHWIHCIVWSQAWLSSLDNQEVTRGRSNRIVSHSRTVISVCICVPFTRFIKLSLSPAYTRSPLWGNAMSYGWFPDLVWTDLSNSPCEM